MNGIHAHERASEAGGGRIVKISSIGGKIGVAHLVPYCASKFALTGLSAALRAELAKDGILVTTVAPGLMRTGSPFNAWFKGRHREDWRNRARDPRVSAHDARHRIRKAVEAAESVLLRRSESPDTVEPYPLVLFDRRRTARGVA